MADGSLEKMPDPYEYESYSAYRKGIYRWEQKMNNLTKYEVMPTNLTAFLRRPKFDRASARYRSTYPKPNHQIDLIRAALGYNEEYNLELNDWIAYDPGWNGILVEQCPNPEIYLNQKSFKIDFLSYSNSLKNLVCNKLQLFNEEGKVRIKDDKYIHNTLDISLATIPYNPKEMGKILKVSEIPCHATKFQKTVYKTPKKSFFYEWCLNKAKPYESVDLITSLRNAYESIPYIYMFKRTPEEFKYFSIYGPNGDKGVPAIFKEVKKEKPINAITFIQIANYKMSKLEPEMLRMGFLFIKSCIENNNFAFLEDIHGLYFFTATYASTLPNGFIITKACFEEAESTKNQLVINSHFFFIEVATSNSLVALARIDGKKSIEGFAKTRLRHSENRLYSLLSKEGHALNEYFLTHTDANSSKVFSVILKTLISYETSDFKKFLRIFKYLEFSVLDRIYNSSHDFFKEFTFLIISSPNLTSRYLLNFTQEITENDIDEPLLYFYSTLSNIKGSKIPDQMLTKCEWLGYALSKLFVLTKEGSEHASELMSRLVKMTARGRMAQPKLRSGSWEAAVSQNCLLLLKMLKEALPQNALINIYDALVSFSREKPFINFFIKKDNLKTILGFIRITDPPELTKLNYKLLRRMFLFHTDKILQFLQNDLQTRTAIVGSIRDIPVPRSIDMIRVLSDLIERLVLPEKKSPENTQVGFLFAVVSLPPTVVSFMKITQEAGFFPGRVLKVLKAERYNSPEIAMNYGHIIHFYDVLMYRKTLMRMVLNYGTSSLQ